MIKSLTRTEDKEKAKKNKNNQYVLPWSLVQTRKLKATYQMYRSWEHVCKIDGEIWGYFIRIREAGMKHIERSVPSEFSKRFSCPICVTIFSNLEVIEHSSNMGNTFALVMDNLIKFCALYIIFKCSLLCYNLHLVDRNQPGSQCCHPHITFNAVSLDIS